MSYEMGVYYRAPEDPEAFEKRYIEGHLPLVQKYPNMKQSSFHKLGRKIAGDFPYAYVFVGKWDDRDGWKADMNSEDAKAATEDAKSFAPPFDVVVWEQLG
jgi:uncharacterized protein (TIGR02118 family)